MNSHFKNKYLYSAVFVIVFFIGFQLSSCNSGNKVNHQSLLVSPEWLSQHLNPDSLVVLHVGTKAGYDSAHIPGAQFISLSDIDAKDPNLRLEVPSVSQLDSVFEHFGVSDEKKVVLYFGKDWVTPTARVYFTLDYLGFGDRTFILNGGLPAWQRQNQPVTTEIPKIEKGSFAPHPQKDRIVESGY